MTESSNPALNESISALVDGESNDIDLQRVLKSLDENDQSRVTWSRYQLISSAMQGESAMPTVDISLAVREAVAKEDLVIKPQRSAAFLRWRSALGKTAVAASVAVAVVLGMQQYSPVSQEEGVEVAGAANTDASSGAVVPRGFELPPISAQTVSTGSQRGSAQNQRQVDPAITIIDGSKIISSEEFQRQINRLMFMHAEQVSSSGSLGAMPFARVSDLGIVQEDQQEVQKESE